jgi:hypothetical protein
VPDPDAAVPDPEACIDEAIVAPALGARVWFGDTTGAGDDVQPSCTNRDAPELVVSFTAPYAARFQFTTVGTGHDTVLALLSDCENEVACNDDTHGVQSEVQADLQLGETVLVVVDGYNNAVGPAQLNITVASEVDRCDNGLDDDGDGDIDCDDAQCPCDAPCVCGAPGCPCGGPDCPCEVDCASADLGAAVGPAVYDDHSDQGGALAIPCGGRPSPAVALRWQAPVDGEYTFDTEGSGYDTAMAIYGTCDGDALACNDDAIGTRSALTRALSQGDALVIVVGGYNEAAGRAVLNITAPLPATEADCANNVDDDQDGATDCDDDDCRDAAACAVLEQFACNDGLDNDGNGQTDCDDAACAGAVYCCADLDLGSVLGLNVAGGRAGPGDEGNGGCGLVEGSDTYYSWTAPADGYYVFDAGTFGSPTLWLKSSCDADALSCNADPIYSDGDRHERIGARVGRTFSAGDAVLIGVDDGGEHLLSIVRVDAEASTTLDCQDDYADGRPDCGDRCQACTCIDQDIAMAMGREVMRGTTVNHDNDWTPSCAAGGTPDRLVRWTAPYTDIFEFTLRPDVNERDYVPALAIRDTCSAGESACAEDGGDGTATLRGQMQAGTSIILAIESANGRAGRFRLSIHGSTEAGHCADGVDNDGDRDTDCDDADCANAPNCAPCQRLEAAHHGGHALTTMVAGLGNRYDLSCTSGDTPDVAVRWVAPVADTYTFRNAGDFDANIAVLDGACGAELACGASRATVALEAGQEVTVIADADPDRAPFIGTLDLLIKTPTEAGHCDDGQNNDDDFRIDCEDDDCADDPVCLDFCAEANLGEAVGDALYRGDLAGQVDQLSGSCQAIGDRDSVDVGLTWQAPAAGRYQVDLLGSNAEVALHVRAGSCVGAEVACSISAVAQAQGRAVIDAQQGDQFVILVENHGSRLDPTDFVLNINPTEHGACEDGQDNDGDGLSDCDDPDCGRARVCLLPCVDVDLGSARGDILGPPDANYRLPEGPGQREGSCGGAGPEHTFLWTANRDGNVLLRASRSFAGDPFSMYVLDRCDGADLICTVDGENRNNRFTMTQSVWVSEGESALIVIDAQFNSGAFGQFQFTPL